VTARLVEVDDGLQVYSPSAVDARFLYREIFTFNGYGDIALPDRPFVIDVGANIGLFLLKVKRAVPDAEVLAFEPMPDLAEAVRANVAHHGLTGVTLHEVALGAERQSDVPFTYYPMLPSSSTRFPEKQERLKEVMGRTFPARVVERMYRGRALTREVARLSDYLDDRPVDLLKVDTSGSELEVLDGIDAAHWPLLREIVLDVQDQNGRVAAICDRLTAAGMQPRVRPAPMAEGDGLNFLIHASPAGT
jgi:FkbM family methyltransferase